MARDEHLRFVDPRLVKHHTHSDSEEIFPTNSSDGDQDSISLHAELGGLVKQALHPPAPHLPTLVEGTRFAADAEAGLSTIMGE